MQGQSTASEHGLSRRTFLAATTAAAGSLALGRFASAAAADSPPARLLFTSQGKTAIVNADGSGLRYFDFQRPGQATWQPSQAFPDGRRVVVLSMEPRRDGPGKPFDEYYTQTPTHLWIYDLATEDLQEICTKDRLAPFVTPALLVGEDRLLVQVVRNRVGQIFSVRLDGSDPREFTKAGEGLPYGFSLSPDGRRVAFHLASPQGYQVWTSDVLGENRVKLAGDPSHLYFGTSWSPDGQWVAYVDCLYQQDHGHDWCDVCVGRADGSEHRKLTEGQSMWFAATYGSAKARGGGSNQPAWTSDGAVLFPRRSPGAQVPWQYRVGQADLDHFNRELKPEEARGGVQICKVDPETKKITELTPLVDNVWDFRAGQSSDGKHLSFCRAKTSETPALFVADASGENPRKITQGIDDLGADHPRWLPQGA